MESKEAFEAWQKTGENEKVYEISGVGLGISHQKGASRK